VKIKWAPVHRVNTVLVCFVSAAQTDTNRVKRMMAILFRRSTCRPEAEFKFWSRGAQLVIIVILILREDQCMLPFLNPVSLD
jgi:hypothetical protein